MVDYFLKDCFGESKGSFATSYSRTPTPLPTSHLTAGCPVCPGTLSPGHVAAGTGVSPPGTEGTEPFLRAAPQTLAPALPSTGSLFRCPLSPTSGLGSLMGFFCRSTGVKYVGSQLCPPQILGERKEMGKEMGWKEG